MSTITARRSYQPGENVSDRFGVVEATRRLSGSDRRPFLTGELRNCSGSIKFIAGRGVVDQDGRPVEIDELVSSFQPESVVQVEGTFAHYKNEPQITVNRVSRVPTEEVDPDDFLPAGPIDWFTLDLLLDETTAAIRSPFRQVVEAALNPVRGSFLSFPAAIFYHHAFAGGLAQHSLEVAMIAYDLAYPFTNSEFGHGVGVPFRTCDHERILRWKGLDLDVLLAAAILHDVGKVDEFKVSVVTSYTDAGHTLGHVFTGLQRVSRACENVGLGSLDSNRLLHAIASHHGLKEQGAATEPATGEAFLIHFADDISAKMNIWSGAVEGGRELGRQWSDRVPGLSRPVWIEAARQAIDPEIGF